MSLARATIGYATPRANEEAGVDENYLSVDAAAAELGVNRVTVWKWVRRYELPTFRFLGDRKTYLRRDDVQRLREPIPIRETKKLVA